MKEKNYAKKYNKGLRVLKFSLSCVFLCEFQHDISILNRWNVAILLFVMLVLKYKFQKIILTVGVVIKTLKFRL